MGWDRDGKNWGHRSGKPPVWSPPLSGNHGGEETPGTRGYSGSLEAGRGGTPACIYLIGGGGGLNHKSAKAHEKRISDSTSS